MRLIALLGMVVAILNFPAGRSGQGGGQAITHGANQNSSKGDTSQQADIGKSGADFMKVCSHAGSGAGNNPQQSRDEANCLGWVEGFADGFTVHDELLGVPRADRLVCIPRNVTNAQLIQSINKYMSSNPEKARRATRLVASLALAQAFPCKRAK
jgi:hypothetical protein